MGGLVPGDTGYVVATPTVVSAGDDIRAETTYVFPYVGSPYYSFPVYDASTGKLESDTWATSSYDGTSAEYVVERPKDSSGTIVPLRNFGTAMYYAGQADGGSGRIGMQNFPLTQVTMTNLGRTVLAQPSANSGQTFTDAWKKMRVGPPVNPDDVGARLSQGVTLSRSTSRVAGLKSAGVPRMGRPLAVVAGFLALSVAVGGPSAMAACVSTGSGHPLIVPGHPRRVRIAAFIAPIKRQAPRAPVSVVVVRDQPRILRLARLLNRLDPAPHGPTIACPADNGSRYELDFGYSGGREVRVNVGLYGCRTVSRSGAKAWPGCPFYQHYWPYGPWHYLAKLLR